MQSDIESACTCCAYCVCRRFCENGTITVEVKSVEIIKKGTLLMKAVVGVGPREQFLCELHQDNHQKKDEEGKAWVKFLENAFLLPVELKEAVAHAVINCYLDILAKLEVTNDVI